MKRDIVRGGHLIVGVLRAAECDDLVGACRALSERVIPRAAAQLI
jgi:hypothetical protein